MSILIPVKVDIWIKWCVADPMRDFAPMIEPTTLVSAHLLSWQTHANEVRLLPCFTEPPRWRRSSCLSKLLCTRTTCICVEDMSIALTKPGWHSKTPTSMKIVTQCDTVQRRDTVLTHRRISSLQLCNWIRTSDSNCSSNFRRGVHAKQNSEMLPLEGPTAGTSGNTKWFWHILTGVPTVGKTPLSNSKIRSNFPGNQTVLVSVDGVAVEIGRSEHEAWSELMTWFMWKNILDTNKWNSFTFFYTRKNHLPASG